MGRKPPIRFTLFEILPNIILKDPNTDTKVTGVIGSILQDSWERQVYKRFNHTLNWVEDGHGVGIKKNGTYNGLLGMIQRNETDSCPIPYSMSAFDGTVEYSSPTNAMVGRILNSPHPQIFPVDLLNCYRGFQNSVWFAVIAMFLLISYLFLKMKKQTKLDAFFKAFALFICQSVQITKNAMFQLMHIGSMILYLAFTQSMNADLLKKDYSPIIDSIADLERQPDVRPVFIDDGTIVSLFEHGANPVYSKLWERAKKIGSRELYVFKMNPTEYSKTTKGGGRLALISTETIIKVAASFGCQKDPNRRSWIAQKPLEDTLFGYYMNPELNKESVQILNDCAYLTIEGGHAEYSWKYAGDNVVPRLLPGAGEPRCIKTNMEDLFVKNDKSYSIFVSNMLHLISGCGILLILAVNALTIEYFC